ncbi:hypothetical protein Cob_v006584 [Colletotrichum orbiculare MAFF 240422]|uniref:Uncharacterized protein n=1 Tax=Colletotrichum orbiculare (strain 104-T / ATCC 96160 / CBS 514.97 / LARS 414 / MAFF 240422) TaxID=1213857 RepID=A0A484FRL9_COLOR|nr:hypothetical protein Cob_v006584 [Colletotrichum orbiculare MAFF 240422]
MEVSGAILGQAERNHDLLHPLPRLDPHPLALSQLVNSRNTPSHPPLAFRSPTSSRANLGCFAFFPSSYRRKLLWTSSDVATLGLPEPEHPPSSPF